MGEKTNKGKVAEVESRAPSGKQRAITPARLLRHLREFREATGLGPDATVEVLENQLMDAIVEEALAGS
jgi:hypothetical protein